MNRELRRFRVFEAFPDPGCDADTIGSPFFFASFWMKKSLAGAFAANLRAAHRDMSNIRF